MDRHGHWDVLGVEGHYHGVALDTWVGREAWYEQEGGIL